MLLKNLFSYLPDLTLFLEDYAFKADISTPIFDPRFSKITGTIDGKDVWGSRCFGKRFDVYAFRDKENLEALIAVRTTKDKNGYYSLARVWCNPSLRGKGLISSLLGFITKKAKNKLKISRTEALTKDGIDWLIKLIKNPRGFSITDKNGKNLDSELIKAEWTRASTLGKRGPTTILIENWRRSVPCAIFGAGYRQLTEMSQHLGDSEID